MATFTGKWFTIEHIVSPIEGGGTGQQLAGIPEKGNVYTVNGRNIVSEWNANTSWQDDWAQRADDIHDAYLGGRTAELEHLIEDAKQSMPAFARFKEKALDTYAA